MRRITTCLVGIAFLSVLVASPSSAAQDTQNYIGHADAVGFCPANTPTPELGDAGIGLTCFHIGGAPSVHISVTDEFTISASYWVQWVVSGTDPVTGDPETAGFPGCGPRTFQRPATATGELNIFIDGPAYRAINTDCIDPNDPARAANGIGVSGHVTINY